MKIEGNKVILKGPENIIFRVKKEEGVIVIQAIDTNNPEYKSNYQNPVIPEGFEYKKGSWENGFTIESKKDGSQFVWVPVAALEADGTLDGKKFNKKFGRRNFRNQNFSEHGFHEKADLLLEQSIQKYGGFYISAFVASMDADRNISFRQSRTALTEVALYEAQAFSDDYARKYESYNNEEKALRSCLPNGAVYDTIFKWIVQTGAKTMDDLIKDSSRWGNFLNLKNPSQILPTGSNKRYCVYNIFDLAGNYHEWSSELMGYSEATLRGGCYKTHPYLYPATERASAPINSYSKNISFRTVLYFDK